MDFQGWWKEKSRMAWVWEEGVDGRKLPHAKLLLITSRVMNTTMHLLS